MTSSMQLVPAISHAVSGPLGVSHLPRLWLKAILRNTQCLAEGWNSGYRGMDQMLIDDLEIPAEPLFAFLETLPTYAQCEAWIGENAGKLSSVAIDAHNERIANHNMLPQYGTPRRAELGFSETSIWNAVILNDLDDWNCLHASLLEGRRACLSPATPLVSSYSMGLLGIRHIPRLWARAIVAATDTPADTYPTSCDVATLRRFGLDVAEVYTYLNAEKPFYLTFEQWLGEHATKVGADTIATQNADLLELRDDVIGWDAIHQAVTSTTLVARQSKDSEVTNV